VEVLVIDIIIIVVLVFFFISGARRGLVRQVLDILGIILAFIGAFYLAHYLARYLEESIDIRYDISLVVSAVAIFIGILVFFHVLGILFKKTAEITLLGSVDRIGGGLFGALKGVLLVSLLLVIAFNIPLPDRLKKEIRNRPLAVAIHPVLPSLFDFVLSQTYSRLDFEKIVRTGRAASTVGEQVEEGKKSMKKRKDDIEKALEDLDD
jgi:membrane protein required for colicin V production